MLKRKRFRFMIVLVIMLSLVLQSTAFGMSPVVDVNQDAVADFFSRAIAGAQNSEVLMPEMETDELDTEEVESEMVTIMPDSVDYSDVENTPESEEGIYVFFNEQELLQIIQQSAVLPPALAQARIAAQEALTTWNETTDWGAAGGNVAAIRDSALAAVDSAIPANVNVGWIGQPLVELGGVNIFDGPFFSGILELTYLSAAGIPHITILRSTFICDRRIEWNSTYYDNRNMFPEDGIARSDMERNMFELENNFGTSRAWGAPNIARVADYLESEFLEMGFAEENVEIIRVDRRNRGLNPDGSTLAALAIPWIGSLTFDIPEEDDPILGTYNHYGPIHYGGMTLPGDGVAVAPEDWPFEAIEDITLVDIGTFPVLNIPEGTSGDVIVATRFVEAGFNLTTQLAPALDALMVSNPDVNIVGAVVARTGRVAWQRSLGGITGGGTSPFPVIMSSCMNLDKLMERGEDLQSFELVRRTHNYGVVATIPADVGPGEDPDMIIVVSAHMDSQGLNSPGASDNSSGTVVAVDLGRHLIELTNEDGVIPGNRIEIQLAPVGAHEGGGGTVSIAIANRILERGLGGVAINMNMDMVMSPSATAGGILMDAVSMDTWMPPTVPAPPGGDAGLRFNLPAYLVIGSIEGVAGDDRDPVLADGIVNARIFRFAGSEHVRFNEAPRLIEAASMIIVEDTTGTNDIGTFYHNAMDSMEFEYCYDRLSMSRDLYLRGILRAVEQEITKQARFTLQGDTLRLANATQIYQTFDRVAGEIVIDDTVIPFTINYPDVTVTNAALAGANASDIVFRNVMASGYGVADHRNTERLTAHPHLARFSTGMVARVELFSGTLRDALAAAEEALNIWNATTNWGAVGGVAGAIRDDALGAVIDAIPSNIRARWVGTPFVELGGVNIFDGPFFGSLLELSYVDSNGVTHTALLRSMFICDRRIEWNSTYYDNRNMFPADGVPRSDMERNVYELENNFGTSRAWGAPNIARVADYLESEFLDMGFARENVEIIRVDRRNRGLNPDGSNLAALTIPWIGSLTFDIPGEDDPTLGTYNHYGPIHYGGMTLPGDGVAVAPEDWPFEAIEDVALVDIGIFPILSIPQGTTGDVIVAVRFVEANLNLTTQLAPALDALMESNPDVNIVGVVLARTGRVAWQRSLGGVTGGGTSPFPVIMSSCMNLSKLIEIREDLQSFELVRRTHNYGVVATIPADVGPGEDPDMIIVVSAHMDSQGLNSPGASDNSSGTVVAVDLGRRLLELTNDDGVIPGNRIEIQLAPVGAHEGGGGTVSIAIANRILERGLGGVAINMNMDMVMSPSATAGGILMDAVSMDTWMPPTPGLPGGDAGLRFNLPAYLVIGSITGVSGDTRDPILADGIVNARIFRFAGSEHVRFNEAPRLIEAASMIIVEDTTGTNDIGTFYHNAMDSMEFEYCYDRLSMSRDLYLRGILRAVEQEITKQARFILEGDTLRLANATQIYRTFDRVAGEIVIDDTVIPFTINYPGVTVTNAALEDANASDIVFRNVMASGYGVADHRNTGRLAANPHLNRFSTGMVADLYVQTVDRDDLRDIIEEAELLEREDFTAANWRLFLPALNHARNVYNNSDSTQAEVDQAINTLRNLINRSMRP